MTEIERMKEKKRQEEEAKKNRKNISKEDYNRVINEDGTLASFNFTDNYKNK